MSGVLLLTLLFAAAEPTQARPAHIDIGPQQVNPAVLEGKMKELEYLRHLPMRQASSVVCNKRFPDVYRQVEGAWRQWLAAYPGDLQALRDEPAYQDEYEEVLREVEHRRGQHAAAPGHPCEPLVSLHRSTAGTPLELPHPEPLRTEREQGPGIGLALAMHFEAQCRRFTPDISGDLDRAVARLREQYPREMREIEESAQFREWRNDPDALDGVPEADRPDREQCLRFVGRVLEGAPPPEARFDSPESTWKEFLGALKTGDAQGALECMTDGGRRRYANMLKHMQRADLARLAAGFKGFGKVDQYGDFQEYFVSRGPDAPGGMVTFVNMNGNWLIDSM